MMSAYDNYPDEEQAQANIRHHGLGVAALGVLVANKEVARFMDGDSVNGLVDWCIENPTEKAIAAQLRSVFEAGYGRYQLGEWFSDEEVLSSARQIVAALASVEDVAR